MCRTVGQVVALRKEGESITSELCRVWSRVLYHQARHLSLLVRLREMA